mmetsp:Transcript_20770/g.31285  ORF Transcript_20770/g.31285 Transcript_20770/m.31285 type:complete len:293 (+) Transcript_20770:110-988(+)
MSDHIAAKILEEQKNLSLTDKVRMNFPRRLHDLVSNAKSLGVDDVISWHPSGSKFMIHSQKEFTTRVLPTVFKQSKFSSFRRQLNAYGFDRESTDPTDSVTFAIFSHKNFLRGDLEACAAIRRRRVNGGEAPLLPTVISCAAIASTKKTTVEKKVEAKSKSIPSATLSSDSTKKTDDRKGSNELLKLASVAQNARMQIKQDKEPSPVVYSPTISKTPDESALLKLLEIQEARRIETMHQQLLLGLCNRTAYSLPSPSLPLLPQVSSLDQETLDRALTLDQALRLSGYKLVKL